VAEETALICECLAGEPERRCHMAQVATRLDAMVAAS
jgi:hypothetical protein